MKQNRTINKEKKKTKQNKKKNTILYWNQKQKPIICTQTYSFIYLFSYSVGRSPGGGGTQYKSGYRDVPQTWVAKSGCQVHPMGP